MKLRVGVGCSITEHTDPVDHIDDNSGLLELTTTTHDQPGNTRVKQLEMHNTFQTIDIVRKVSSFTDYLFNYRSI